MNPRNSRCRAAFWALWPALGLLVFGLAVLGDFGVTWDEPLHHQTAEFYLRSFLSGRTAFTAEDFPGSMQYYGPFFDLWGEVSHRLFSLRLGWLPETEARHLHLLLLGAGTVFFTFLIAAEGGSLRGAFLGAFLLAVSPRFLGHSFNNPKDIPLACAAAGCLYFFLRRLRNGRVCWSLGILVLGGIAFASRFTYIIVVFIMFLYLILNLVLDLTGKVPRSERAGFPADLLLGIFLSLPLGLLLWPYFWSETIPRFWEMLEFYALHPVQARVEVLYRGRTYLAGQDLPWHYAPVMLLVGLPLPALLAALGAAAAGGAAFFRRRARDPVLLLCLVWTGGGLIPFMLPGQRVYGGIRHFLFVVPAICILAGRGLDLLCGLPGLWPGRAGKLLAGGVLILSLLQLRAYHPYYTCFYNALAGGARGAFGRYSLDNWGNAYRQGCLWLNRHARPFATVFIPGPVPPALASRCLRPDLRILDGDTYGRLPGSVYDYSLYTIRAWNPLKIKRAPVFVGEAAGQPVVLVHEWNR